MTAMDRAVRLHQYSFADYLALEEVSTVRHEFLDGEIYGMAGGTVLHAALSAAIIGTLHAQLAGRCRVYSSDLRIRVPATGLATYADADPLIPAIDDAVLTSTLNSCLSAAGRSASGAFTQITAAVVKGAAAPAR